MEPVNIYSKQYWIDHLNAVKTVKPPSSIKEFAIKLFITREIDAKKAEEARQLNSQLNRAPYSPPIFTLLKRIVSQEELVYSSRTVWRPSFFGIAVVIALFPLQLTPPHLKNRIALITALFVSISLAFYAHSKDVKKISDLSIDIRKAIADLNEYTEKMAPRPAENTHPAPQLEEIGDYADLIEYTEEEEIAPRPPEKTHPALQLEEIGDYIARQDEIIHAYVLEREQENQALGKHGFWDPRLSDMILRRD